ncbi:hypothetical protein [Vibrio sp. 03_296]|nr:hypothetical protein [Vibrio sp. 03_296]
MRKQGWVDEQALEASKGTRRLTQK